jgi:hypothetical protein
VKAKQVKNGNTLPPWVINNIEGVRSHESGRSFFDVQSPASGQTICNDIEYPGCVVGRLGD